MSKKTNSIIFMAGATVLNMVLLFLFLLLGIIILGLLPIESANVYSIGIILVFLLSIVLSFLTYSKLVKWATARFGLEEKLDPIFTPKRNRRNKMD